MIVDVPRKMAIVSAVFTGVIVEHLKWISRTIPSILSHKLVRTFHTGVSFQTLRSGLPQKHSLNIPRSGQRTETQVPTTPVISHD